MNDKDEVKMNDKEEYKRFSISLPKNLFDEFDQLAKTRNTSRSDAIRKAMSDYILKLSKDERLIGMVHSTAIIILNMEHTYQGKAHDHEKLSSDDHSHAHEHTHESDVIIKKILESNYFTYPDTDLIKINHLEHIFHDIVITKLHVHSDHNKCLVIIPVDGPGKRIQEFYTIVSKLKSILSHDIIFND